MNIGEQIIPMLTSLGLVLGLFLLAARFLPRLLQLASASAPRGRVQSCIALGPRERLVVVECDGERLLLGVAPGRISLLKTLGDQPKQRTAVAADAATLS